MEFYLPNFEDLVDPGYDFVHDRYSPGRRDRFKHDWYAHQFFKEPIFDGVLMSKTVVKPRVEAHVRRAGGVHAFMRLSPEIPVMGDCGAFSYRSCKKPPYTTEEMLDYYQSLGFTYGVSVDHVIFRGFPPEEQDYRWNLTLRNAAEFIKQHRQKGCTFTPVGIAQGPSPERYAQAVRRLVEMGYDHLALGGLARSGDEEVRQVLEAVSPELPPGARLHLFGVARLALVPDFLRFGVTSADSAAPILRAFLGSSNDNYWMPDGRRYTAIRVPEAKEGVPKKRGVDSTEQVVARNGVTLEALKQMEQRTLHLLRAYDAGQASLEETLQAALSYDRLYGKLREKDAAYQRTLEEMPWKQCSCPICQSIGIEVVIFRSNNRNRRRGFHNVKVFYGQFRQAIKNAST